MTSSVVPKSNWETYVTFSDDGPLFISFWVDLPSLNREEFSNCARVLIHLKTRNQNGGPQQSEADQLYSMEDRLMALLADYQVPCVQVARITFSGIREIVVHNSDWNLFRPPVGLWMKEFPNYEIEVSEHEGWQFVEDIVWPSDDEWMFIGDRRVIDNLIEAGSDPEKAHELEFVFLGHDQGLVEMKRRLIARSYTEYKGTVENGQIVMVKTMPLNLTDVYAESITNEKAAEELGITVDGWGASVVPFD